jgi:hypothetical protein
MVDVPEANFAVNERDTKLPGVETEPAPNINPYMSTIVPAVLLMVPALKNVVYPLKIVPSVTEFAKRSEGLYEIRNSYDLIN